jgi:hypothetical protein
MAAVVLLSWWALSSPRHPFETAPSPKSQKQKHHFKLPDPEAPPPPPASPPPPPFLPLTAADAVRPSKKANTALHNQRAMTAWGLFLFLCGIGLFVGFGLDPDGVGYLIGGVFVLFFAVACLFVCICEMGPANPDRQSKEEKDEKEPPPTSSEEPDLVPTVVAVPDSDFDNVPTNATTITTTDETTTDATKETARITESIHQRRASAAWGCFFLLCAVGLFVGFGFDTSNYGYLIGGITCVFGFMGCCIVCTFR